MDGYGLLELGLLVAFLAVLAAGMWVLSWEPWPIPVSHPRALARARALVRELLSEAEWQQLQQTGWLEVPSRTRPGARYRIPAIPGPVEVVEATGEHGRLCLVPTSAVPAPELVLVHKLWIEADETEYLRRANRLPAASGRQTIPRDAWRLWWGG